MDSVRSTLKGPQEISNVVGLSVRCRECGLPIPAEWGMNDGEIDVGLHACDPKVLIEAFDPPLSPDDVEMFWESKVKVVHTPTGLEASADWERHLTLNAEHALVALESRVREKIDGTRR